MICGDNTDFAGILSQMLDELGIASDTVATAHAAKQLMNKHNYHALLLDLTLPDLDGLHLIQELREKIASRLLPIIVISGRADEAHAAMGNVNNVVDWIQKHIVREQFVHSLKRALQLQKMPRILHVEDDTDFAQITRALVDDIAEYTVDHSLAKACISNLTLCCLI